MVCVILLPMKILVPYHHIDHSLSDLRSRPDCCDNRKPTQRCLQRKITSNVTREYETREKTVKI